MEKPTLAFHAFVIRQSQRVNRWWKVIEEYGSLAPEAFSSSDYTVLRLTARSTDSGDQIGSPSLAIWSIRNSLAEAYAAGQAAAKRSKKRSR
jgi:hypothetical protein